MSLVLIDESCGSNTLQPINVGLILSVNEDDSLELNVVEFIDRDKRGVCLQIVVPKVVLEVLGHLFLLLSF